MSLLFISHDLVSAYGLCHHLALINAGQIVECNTPQAIFFSPQHPFTQKQIASIPTVPNPAEVEAALWY